MSVTFKLPRDIGWKDQLSEPGIDTKVFVDTRFADIDRLVPIDIDF